MCKFFKDGKEFDFNAPNGKIRLVKVFAGSFRSGGEETDYIHELVGDFATATEIEQKVSEFLEQKHDPSGATESLRIQLKDSWSEVVEKNFGGRKNYVADIGKREVRKPIKNENGWKKRIRLILDRMATV